MAGPFSLTVYVGAQQVTSTAKVEVANHGTESTRVHGLALGSGCARDVTVTPATFTLQPGQQEMTTVHFASGGTYVIAYEGSTAGKGNVHLTGAAGVRIHSGTSSRSCVPHVTAAAPASHADGLGGLWMVLIGAALLVLALTAYGLSKRRGGRHAHL